QAPQIPKIDIERRIFNILDPNLFELNPNASDHSRNQARLEKLGVFLEKTPGCIGLVIFFLWFYVELFPWYWVWIFVVFGAIAAFFTKESVLEFSVAGLVIGVLFVGSLRLVRAIVRVAYLPQENIFQPGEEIIDRVVRSRDHQKF